MTLQFSAPISDFNLKKGLAELRQRRTPWLYRQMVTLAIGFVLALYAIGIVLPDPHPTWFSMLFLVLIIGTFSLLTFRSMKRRHRLFAEIQNAKLRAIETHFSISRDGYSEESSLHQLKLTWGAFIGVEKTHQGLVLLISEGEFYSIPRSAFKTEAELDKAFSAAQSYIDSSGESH